MRARSRAVLVLLLAVVPACGGGGERGRAAGAAAAGTETRAAVRPAAPAPTGSEPLPVAKPSLTLADRATFRRALGWSEDCEQGFDAADSGYGGIEVDALAPSQYLVGVVCARGAYQGYRIYYYYDKTQQPPAARPLVFETRESPDERSLVRTATRELWGLPTFDRQTRQLRVLNKFRGPGDCGILATYKFVAGVPELTELRAKPVCDGKGAEEPERWPLAPLR